jgi:hypothetical protein
MIAVGYLLSASGLVPFSRAVLRYHVCTTAYPSLSDPQRRSRAPDPHINRCEPPSLSGYFGLITKEIWGEGEQHVFSPPPHTPSVPGQGHNSMWPSPLHVGALVRAQQYSCATCSGKDHRWSRKMTRPWWGGSRGGLSFSFAPPNPYASVGCFTKEGIRRSHAGLKAPSATRPKQPNDFLTLGGS